MTAQGEDECNGRETGVGKLHARAEASVSANNFQKWKQLNELSSKTPLAHLLAQLFADFATSVRVGRSSPAATRLSKCNGRENVVHESHTPSWRRQYPATFSQKMETVQRTNEQNSLVHLLAHLLIFVC